MIVLIVNFFVFVTFVVDCKITVKLYIYRFLCGCMPVRIFIPEMSRVCFIRPLFVVSVDHCITQTILVLVPNMCLRPGSCFWSLLCILKERFLTFTNDSARANVAIPKLGDRNVIPKCLSIAGALDTSKI